ncbi:MAG: cell wall hydrolase [Cetobacterium sp.]|uniref:cell wall hydrolase n=1 Tax=Cetobacterium sp. TaxID=2071632 RepID=UPI003EE8096D
MALCEIAVLALTLNVWHEARGESYAGQLAVAEVTLNRVKSKHYPDNVLDVVTQRKQFSWTIGKGLDGTAAVVDYHANLTKYLNTKHDIKAWKQAEAVARKVLADGYKPKRKHLMFHTVQIRPYWSQGKQGMVIGSHKFY